MTRHVQCRRLSANKGFSIVSAIFLLVILTALGAAILNISTVQHASSALDVQGARAYQAARAGIEWGLYTKLQTSTKNTYCNNAATPTSTSFSMPAGTTLSSFTVTVVCSYFPRAVTPTAAMTTSALTAASNIATATTASGHGLSPGDQITMSGAIPTTYNGTYTVETVPTGTTFTYLLDSTPAAATTQGSFTSRTQSLDRRRLVATACNQPASGTNSCPNPSASPDYVERVVQVEF
jgi:MSHA biogenesis protein MshP